MILFTPPLIPADRIEVYGLLKNYIHSNRMRFYEPNFGYIDCHIFGVKAIDAAKNSCEIPDNIFKIMQFEAREYGDRLMYGEQKYKLLVYPNGCKLHFGAKIYNEEMLKSGYALFYKDYRQLTKEEKEYFKKLKAMYDKAKQEGRGLWKEFRKEMRCMERG